MIRIGQLAHHRIRNVPSYPLVFVAKLYHTRERDGAGGGGIPPPPPQLRSHLVKKEVRARVKYIERRSVSNPGYGISIFCVPFPISCCAVCVLQEPASDHWNEGSEWRRAALALLRTALEDGPPPAAAAAAAAGSVWGAAVLRDLLRAALRRAGPQRAALLLPLWPAGGDDPELAALRRPPPSVAALCAAAVSEEACHRLVEEGETEPVDRRPSLETVLLSGRHGDTLSSLMVSVGTDRW